MSREEPMLDIANGDIGMSRHLTKVLNILTASPGIDKDMKAQFQDILQGKGTIRDLAHSEAFKSLGDNVLPRALADFDATSSEERQRMAERGEAVLEEYRNQGQEAPAHEETPRGAPPTAPPSAPPAASSGPTSRPASHVVSGTRKPNRDRIVAPSDLDDDDDQYFQDRNRGGWLR